MNRIQQLTASTEVITEPSFTVEQARVEASEVGGLELSTFVPLHYEPNYAYPLLVWLHGPGDNEHQLRRIMPLVSMRNFVAVAPRGTWRDASDGESRAKFGWRQEPDAIMSSEQRLWHCIESALSRFHITEQKVFLAGYECGGTMAFRLAMNQPNRFAGVVSIGGPFPVGHYPLQKIDEARRLPLLIAHGRDSRKYSVDQVCSDLRLFHSAGMKVTLRQYPCGDDITTKMLADMNTWIMEQVTGFPTATDSGSCYQTGELN